MSESNHHLSSFERMPLLARRHPSAFLFAAQLLSLAFYALLDESTNGRILLSVFGIVVLVLVVLVINHSRAVRWTTWVLVIPAIALSLLSLVLDNPNIVAWSALLETLLYFYAAGSLITYMMGDTRVTTDELFAAGATFTLLAWGFAFAYQAVMIWSPGAFEGGSHPGQPQTFVELLALSFTNLTATGLGDIVPKAPPARVLVMIEQFAGIGYVAMVVSRLIGMSIGRQRRKRAGQ